MDIIKYYSSDKNSFSFSEFYNHHKSDIVNHCLEIDVTDENDWASLKDTWFTITNDFKKQNEDVNIQTDLFRVDWSDLLLLRKLANVMRKNKRKIKETLNEHSNSVVTAMKSPRLSCEDPFSNITKASIGNLEFANKIKEARNKVNYVAELSKQDKMYFGILNFSQNTEKNCLKEALGENDFKRFKSDFTATIQTSTYAGNSCKRILFLLKDATNKKKELKKEKEKVLVWSDADYLNEDSYLYFVLSPIFKSLLGNDPRTLLLFGETNLKAKAIEVNRYLFDDERRFAGPKIDLIVRDEKYDLEIMVIELSGPPSKTNLTHFLEMSSTDKIIKT